MKQIICSVLFFIFSIITYSASAQCSICTKTAQQMGEGPAKGLNAGILYLMAAPFIIVAIIACFWWRQARK